MSKDCRGGLVLPDDYHRPIRCTQCGGIMVFKGVGEYECEDCKHLDYDDYGKVRLYIENHKGATAIEVEKGTGVKQKAIRNMLREERLEVSADSKTFLRCEACGAQIRSGRFCAKCAVSMNRRFEEEIREKKIQGFGLSVEGESGEKRFIRKR